MDKSLSKPISSRLNLALDSWSDWGLDLRSKPDQLKALSGNTNDSFLLRSDEKHLVLRLNSQEALLLGINRQREYKILEQIRTASFAPVVYHMADDFMVSEYISAPNLTIEELTAAKLVIVAEAIKHIHSISIQCEPPLNLALELERYFNLIEDSSLKVQLLPIHTFLIARIPQAHHRALCHNDLLTGNLFFAHNQVQIIDWEYANMGDPIFDLAVFVENYRLSDSNLNIFLQAYGSTVNPDQLKAPQLIYRYLEILWWLVRQQGLTQTSREMIDRMERRVAADKL